MIVEGDPLFIDHQAARCDVFGDRRLEGGNAAALRPGGIASNHRQGTRGDYHPHGCLRNEKLKIVEVVEGGEGGGGRSRKQSGRFLE